MIFSKTSPQSIFVKSRRLVSFLSVLCVLCGYAFGQDWKTVHDGVEHAQVEKEISGLKVKMNLLRLDLKKVRLDVHHALDGVIGVEKTSSIAARHGGVAAINSGFFRLDGSIFVGDPAGILKINGILLSESYNDRSAMLISNLAEHTEVYFGPAHIDERLSSKRLSIILSGVNRERKVDEVVRYTPEFGRTTLTDATGLEVVVVKRKVTEMRDQAGSTPVPTDGYVLSATGKFREQFLRDIRLGNKIELITAPTVDNGGHIMTSANTAFLDAYFKAEDITNGVPQLIKNGKIDITWEQEKTTKSFVETRHPRTAVAKLKDGKFLMITVDGRSESSGGISLYDLADYLLSLGAVDAMNLDGGGSTTMFLDGKVVNTPSDKEGERKVGDAIVVTLRNPKKR
jgi:exopolysaccharide biosynthesis protein